MLNNDALHCSPVVANCNMNRERQLTGSNGYSFELKFDIPSWIESRLERHPFKWLDVCCGTGNALIEAVQLFAPCNSRDHLSVIGIDLAGHFLGHDSSNLLLTKSSIESWSPQLTFDLVTCVHGLHYIGDKLGAIQELINCLSADGLFVANIDLSNLRFSDERLAGRTVVKRFRDNGIEYDKNNRLLRCHGGREIESFGLEYCGADDEAGPNYTGQPAVNSYYSV